MNEGLVTNIAEPESGVVFENREEPLRSEIYSLRQLEAEAVQLSRQHEILFHERGSNAFFRRFEENRQIIAAAYKSIGDIERQNKILNPSEEWLIDNYHIVVEQIREIREDLPKEFYYQLPKLKDGKLNDVPRVYSLAENLIGSTDSLLDGEHLNHFIKAYQNAGTALTIGEIWALPIALRLVLIENLRRVAVLSGRIRREQKKARDFAHQILQSSREKVFEQIARLQTIYSAENAPDPVWVAQLIRRLRNQDEKIYPLIDALERKISESGKTIEEIFALDQNQAAILVVTTGNIFAGFRWLKSFDWSEFFEQTSKAEEILRRDPANVYPKMDFATRNRYRREIERIARRSQADELEIAARVVELSKNSNSEIQSHIGFFLLDDPHQTLETDFKYQPTFGETIRRTLKKYANFSYIGTIFIITALIVFFAALIVNRAGGNWGAIALTVLLAIVLAMTFAVSFINWLAMKIFTPTVLPKMDFSKGIPADAETIIIIPTMFGSFDAVREMFSRLEVHYLSNSGERTRYAILSDFNDADAEEKPTDAAILEFAEAELDALNRRHSAETNNEAKFHLFHRRRQWSETERKWIGWERKRGKIEEFNRYLRGAVDTSFIVSTLEQAKCASIKYVITLDSDTKLPPGTARKLVGIAAHPLNQPHFSGNRMTRGYAILQPRVSITAESVSQSVFAQIMAGFVGLDPYTTAASDVYQDIFDAGIYTGKGLYVVDAFEHALENRIPPESLLSHDLFESIFARAALVSDVEFFDDYPALYEAHAKRQHRWVRGDWQLLPWLVGRIPNANGEKTKNVLSLVSRWKIFDNLRRSLIAPSIFLLFAAAWIVLPAPPLYLTLLLVFVLAFPIYAHVSNGLFSHPRGINWDNRLEGFSSEVILNTLQFFLTVIFLPHQAFLMVDAIVRTVWRVYVSRRNLLEWQTAAQIEQSSKRDLLSGWRFMQSAIILSSILLILVLAFRPDALLVAVPFVVLWLISPIFVFYVNQIRTYETESLKEDSINDLRSFTRQTWRFFQAFINEENNFLPPDNFQEDPAPLVAHRTSPTNIGLLFLANVAANDFGYIGLAEMLERTEKTIEIVNRLEKYNGHLLNWYDTRTLEPLLPRYVSTVDSGNLAGHLIALKQSLLEKIDAPVFPPNVREGLLDGWQEVVARLDIIERIPRDDKDEYVQRIAVLRKAIRQFLKQTNGENGFAAEWIILLDNLAELRRTVGTEPIKGAAEEYRNFEAWLDSFVMQIESLRRDADEFFEWRRFLKRYYAGIASFSGLKTLNSLRDLRDNLAAVAIGNDSNRAASLNDELHHYSNRAAEFINRLETAAAQAEEIALAMDFKFLVGKNQKLFAIGYNVSDNRLDNSCYDLLASEARLASLFAIAKGDLPSSHWFRLGRPETMLSAGRALVSWSGTMFEYLMPLLVMKTFPGTLLDQTYRAVVERQIEYGDLAKVPWGISESGYNARDLQLNYQYGPFGVPGLGLKRGLNADLVVAPYATVLAAMVAPESAVKNLRRLKEKDFALGNFGFYEAIDFTPDRIPENKRFAVVKNYMAHHQGMSFLALHNVLNDNVMQERFHRDSMVKAVELLLQERAVQSAPLVETNAEENPYPKVHRQKPSAPRIFKNADTNLPQVQMLSNRRYSVMITNAGSGFSTFENTAITRWREDATRDNWGQFVYLSDASDASKYWSATVQPVGERAESYEAAFTDDRAVFRRRDFGIGTHTEIIVSSEDNVEMRQITLTNHTGKPREIFVTSYTEIVLNTAAADAAHPAFSNLFIETEYVESEEALIARRRPRSEREKPVFGVHVARIDGKRVGEPEYETDRAKFLGRNRTTANPSAILSNEPLSKTTGAVIDPIFSLRYRLQIPARGKATICFSTGIAETRDEAIRLADKYNNPNVFERESSLAWTKARVEQRHLRIAPEEAAAFQSIASRLLYSSADFRAANNIIRQNNRIQSNLWAYGVSGDIPILLVKVKSSDDIEFVKQILRGQEYLRSKNLKFDLVILNLHPEGYAQNVQEELNLAVRTGGFQQWLGKPAGVFILRKNMLPEEDARLFEAIARVVFEAEAGTIVEQLKKPFKREETAAKLNPISKPVEYADESPWIPPLKLFNGIGGFTEDGREYVISLKNGQKTPAPWLNVIANGKDFGFQISESGAGYTWSVNSRENRLTTWTNDFVSDQPSEAFYLRDEETGEFWSPLPSPVPTTKDFLVKHGQGYSQFLHNTHGIIHDSLFFVPLDETVKIAVLRIENKSNRRRNLSLWNYTELVMGVQREKSAPSIVSAIDTNHQVLFAYNRYNNEFANRSAFFATNAKLDSHTADRREFLGRNGSLANPLALSRTNLKNQCNPKLDACFATHTNLQLEPNETTVIVYLLGETETDDKAREIVEKFRNVAECYRALDEVKAFWDKTLTRVEIKTPDEATNMLVNRWLLYQTLVCRVWARSAFYQSGGAIGFRDQLQDVMSLVHTNPSIVRKQILLAAERQFKEGDVQHWWHPPTGRGVRTKISDDLLWLPFVTAHYLKATNDTEILNEKITFLEARELAPDEEDMYIVPNVSDEEATLFEHCRRAVERSLKFGEHDLPLMGSGDWNDGMNQVGIHGKGESVWLAWFQCAVLKEFAAICEQFGDEESAEKYLAQAETIRANVEENAWDGEWYRRAYFDNGTPLGSKENDECKIDAIAQSWSVISGAGDKNRAQTALKSVEKHLIKRERGIILLFTPPFDTGNLEPGYIKGYVPGVRENGGQYAHGALWTVIAYALAGNPDLSAELFSLINPINHSKNLEEAMRYKNEPYVFTADIHNTKNNVGRGGWSWYTGSAAWAYRAATEFMFGLHKRGDKLLIRPHFPKNWQGSELIYRFGGTTYNFRYEISGETENPRIYLDDKLLESSEIALIDDGKTHYAKIV